MSVTSIDQETIQELPKVEKCLIEESPLLLLKNAYLKIKTKTAKLIPLTLKFAQAKIYKTIVDKIKAKEPVRLIVLKARQVGVSTLIESMIYAMTAMRDNVNSLIIADDDDGANYLFEMTKTFHEELAKDFPNLYTPKKYSNEKKIEFDNRRSQIIPETAANKDAGRKYTFQNVHCSEMAFWEDAETVMTGIMQAVPDNAETMVVIESTANGQGNYFHSEWRRAEQGRSGWTPIFIGWFWDTDYELGLPCSPDVFYAHLQADEKIVEKDILAQFPATDKLTLCRKLNWRRWAIENKCSGKVKLFQQEYPSNAREAFLGTGRHRFDFEVLEEYKKYCSKPTYEGYLIEETYGAGVRIGFRNLPGGSLQIWRQPEIRENYVLSADVAEGLHDGNYSVVDVFKGSTREQVAHWHGHVAPDEFGDLLDMMGRYYNKGLVVPEANNHGVAVCLKLKELEYPNIYTRKRYDRMRMRETDQLGWKTDLHTKPTMIAYLDEDLKRRDIKINCKETIEEMETFVQFEDGTMGHEVGEGIHDDRVISCAIGNFICRVTPGVVPSIVRAGEDDEGEWGKRAGVGGGKWAGSRKTGY